jgi:hypothetical protein
MTALREGERFAGAVRIGARRSGARPNAMALWELSILAERAVVAFTGYSGLSERDVVITIRIALMGSRAAWWFEDPCGIRWFESLFADVAYLWREGRILGDRTCKVRPVVAEDELRYLELINRRMDRPVKAPRPRRAKRAPRLRLVCAAGGAP